MSSLSDKISELEQQLAVLRAEAEKEEKQNKSMNKRWRAKLLSQYWNDKIDWSDNPAKRYLSYNYSTQSICTRSVWALKEPRVIYFSSKGIAEQAIDEIGAEKIKEYLTYEW